MGARAGRGVLGVGLPEAGQRELGGRVGPGVALLYTPLGGNLHSAVNAGHQNFTSGVSFSGKNKQLATRIKASQPYIKAEDEIKSNNDYPKYSQNIKRNSKSQSQVATGTYAASNKISIRLSNPCRRQIQELCLLQQR